MKYLIALAVLAATPLQAQQFGASGGRTFSADIGLGAQVTPEYPGSDEAQGAPWLIFRNAGFGDVDNINPQGLSFGPSFGTEGERDPSDDRDLSGLDKLDRAYEIGGKITYGIGDVTGYLAVRRGFDGHEGVTGEVGAKYRTVLSDRVTLWSGLELGYGNGEYNDTYFGVTSEESAASGYGTYAPGGGFNMVAATFEARYAINDSTALLGEIQYGRLIGDAADSPIVQDKDQPALRVGIVRNFSFGF